MTNEENKKKNSIRELSAGWGIIIGVILTIIGVIIHVHLQQRYEREKYKQEKLDEFISSVSSVYRLGHNVTTAVGSLVFDNRWESYINDGYIPWLIKKGVYKKFISNHYPELLEHFNAFETKFDEVNTLNVVIRQQHNDLDTLPTNNFPPELRGNKNVVKEKYKHIGERVKKINETDIKMLK